MTDQPVPLPILLDQPAPLPILLDQPAPRPILLEQPAPRPILLDQPDTRPIILNQPGPRRILLNQPGPRPIMLNQPAPRPNTLNQPKDYQIGDEITDEDGKPLPRIAKKKQLNKEHPSSSPKPTMSSGYISHCNNPGYCNREKRQKKDARKNEDFVWDSHV